MKRLTKNNELNPNLAIKSLPVNLAQQVFSNFSGNGVYMVISMLLILGLTSCAKDDISIEPNQAIVLSGPGGDPSLLAEAEHTFERATTNDPVQIELELAAPVVFDVQEPVEGENEDYILQAQSEGMSPEYGEFIVTINLRVNSETGQTNGTILYTFTGSQSLLQFNVAGFISDWVYAEFSELEITLLQGAGEFTGASGLGDAFLLGNIFHDMQNEGQVESYTSTSCMLEMS